MLQKYKEYCIKFNDFVFVPDKLAVMLFIWIVLNSQFGIITIEHNYYDENNNLHTEFLEQYDTNELNKIQFSNPYKIGMKLNLIGLTEPKIIYPDYIKKSSGYNETFVLHQKTFLFSKSFDVTEQFKKEGGIKEINYSDVTI